LTGVQIHIPSFLQAYAENMSQAYAGGSTIMECLTILVERFPQLKSRLFTTEDKLRRELNIYLNKSQVYPREFSRPVKDGDKLYIAHVIVGG
jgi:molybdopterin converting factor small subunit